MYNLIFLLLFVTILCHGKSTCDKQTPVCDKKVDPVCRKTPFTFCVPNIIQNNTQCVCDTTKTKMGKSVV